MIYLKSETEIEYLRESALIVSRTLAEVAKRIEPGVQTGTLDRVAEDYIKSQNATPAFKGYGNAKNPFPASLCISVNEEVVHGIPGSYKLCEGDIVSIDCGVEKNGYFGDHAFTFCVGECDDKTRKLLKVTLESLHKGIDKARHGNKIGDISHAVQSHCDKEGYGVVRDLVGHGIGKSMHEEPSVPNFGKENRGQRLRAGMSLAIEPMITMRGWQVKTLNDGWTVVTSDNSIAAHYEHDIVVREGEPDILSTFDYIYEITNKRKYTVC